MPYGYWYNQSGLGCCDQRGMSDVERGSLIRWAGWTPYRPSNSFSDLWNPPYSRFRDAIQARGFTVTNILEEDANGSGVWWFVEAIVPSQGSLDGAGTFITAAAYEVFGNVSDVQVVDAGAIPIASTPAVPAVPPAVPLNPPAGNPTASGAMAYANPKIDPCAGKSGLEWLSCTAGFDGVASQFGLAAGAGATLALAVLALVAIVVIKK